MKIKIIGMLTIAALVMGIAATVALAGDRGPQYATTTTAATNATVTVAVPTGETGRFTPTWLHWSGQIGQTQTVYAVTAGVTNQLASKVLAANATLLEITNCPPLFNGDTFQITQSQNADTNGVSAFVGTTNRITLVGTLFD